MSNAAPKPAKQAVKTLKNPLKAVRDVSGYTDMKDEAAKKQQEQEARVAAAESKQAEAAAAVEDKAKAMEGEAAKKRSARRRAGAGRGGYRSLLSPARSGDVSSSLSGNE